MNSEYEEAARRHFDSRGHVYTRSRLLSWLRRRALALLEPRPDDRVLDVACGAGALVRELSPVVRQAVGVDLSPRMLERARALSAREGIELGDRVNFLQASSAGLPFPPGAFSAVVCTTALHHFPEPQEAVAEMARVLTPGGRIVIGDLSRDPPWMEVVDRVALRFERGHVGLQRRRGVESLLDGAGLAVTDSLALLAGSYALVRATGAVRRTGVDRG